jgi:hypothetical protein
MTVFPSEANAVFVVDPDGVLSDPPFQKWMQFVSRRRLQVIEALRRIDHRKLPFSHIAHSGGNGPAFALFPKGQSAFVSERFNH